MINLPSRQTVAAAQAVKNQEPKAHRALSVQTAQVMSGRAVCEVMSTHWPTEASHQKRGQNVE